MIALQTLKAGYFKAHCLELMDYVLESGREIVITKHGRPVAKLAPLSPVEQKPLWGLFKNQIQVLSDIVEPLEESWDANR
ncbi:MAG: type II toxin-antitoxin system prevent-host-death family antitoxin [Myxococcaceae bacterium]